MPHAEEDLALWECALECSYLHLIAISHDYLGPDRWTGVPDPLDKERNYLCRAT